MRAFVVGIAILAQNLSVPPVAHGMSATNAAQTSTSIWITICSGAGTYRVPLGTGEDEVPPNGPQNPDPNMAC
ncbi:MAG: hypothetical protein AAF986_06205, partial [Pseudomonadota bacterium]